ncbi:MAG: hypothetical protein IJ576_08500 [Synergistaceae bacterium]|nr:hypothetical protein [Synergistaceae bacterium]
MKKFLTAILAMGAMACAAAAGHLFYLERFASGIAMLIMTLIFLSYAMNRSVISYDYDYNESGEPEDIIIDTDKVLGDMALLIADISISNLKNIGRTIPASTKEITELEDKLNSLLNQIGVAAARRNALQEELDKLKGRTRLNEGGTVLMRSARL